MRISFATILFSVALVAGLAACSEKEEGPVYEPVTNYLPLQKGKYITYRIDSLVTTAFNVKLTTHSYQVKHVIDDLVTDAAGRPAYRVYRYLNDENASGQWVPNGTYTITVLDNQIEVTEDNLRFVKLRAPLREDFTWRGNAFLPADSYEPYGFNFGVDNNMQKWDYYYLPLETSWTYKGNTYKDIQTVEHQNQSQNLPVRDSITPVANRYRSVEKFSKNIGLVYREYILWEYQMDGITLKGTYSGFGITMWMIDHN